jgi:hypothetical protein
VRQLESPQTVSHGPREGAFAVTEQFAFDQLARDGPAIDGHKRAASAGALGMQGLGHQFFASAAFARDQGCRRRRRQGLDELAQKLRRSALSNDLGFGAGFHVKSVLGGTRWLSAHAHLARCTESAKPPLKSGCRSFHWLVEQLTNATLASIFKKYSFIVKNNNFIVHLCM